MVHGFGCDNFGRVFLVIGLYEFVASSSDADGRLVPDVAWFMHLPLLASHLLRTIILMAGTITVIIAIVIIGTTGITNMVITAFVAVAPVMRVDEYDARHCRRWDFAF